MAYSKSTKPKAAKKVVDVETSLREILTELDAVLEKVYVLLSDIVGER